MTRGVLALLGSGETAPGMTKIHRELLARFESPVAVNLNTGYGFQENVTQMSEKLEEYFRVSLTTPLTTIEFASYAGATELECADVKRRVREANYVFAGPGSPSYALEQWTPLALSEDLLVALSQGATLCFSSAAALTLGAFTAPIYEIYKVGTAPHWLEGMNVLSAAGLECAVIPHFDNAEGGNHDTSRCYLGERRLERMRLELPVGTATLGVDEHTAFIIDLDHDTATVKGRGSAYWMTDTVRVLANGSTTSLSELRSREWTTPLQVAPSSEGQELFSSGFSLARTLGERLNVNSPDQLAALSELVALAERGRSDLIEPATLVNGVLEARRSARENKQFQLADQLRDALVEAGIEVNDGPDGTSWVIRS